MSSTPDAELGTRVGPTATATTALPEIVRSIVVDGQRLRVSIRPGHGDGLPLVLCNGIGSSLELLDPFVAVYDPATTVIRFDVPGTGGSPAPSLPYHLAVLARTLGGLLDQLGHERVDVLGISWGGALAQQFAWQNPRRCHRLVLVATSTGAMMVPGRASVLARMVISGRDDPIVPTANARILAAGLPRGMLHLHDGGHLDLVTDADRLAEVVRAFLAPL